MNIFPNLESLTTPPEGWYHTLAPLHEKLAELIRQGAKWQHVGKTFIKDINQHGQVHYLMYPENHPKFHTHKYVPDLVNIVVNRNNKISSKMYTRKNSPTAKGEV